MSKISYATYIKDRVDGFSGESERKAPKDLDDFPSFKKNLSYLVELQLIRDRVVQVNLK